MTSPPTSWRRFRGPALAASALLLAGYLRTAPGAELRDPFAYRRWSFAALAYSDVIALHADRGARPHAVPFYQDRIEYPVLTALAMWWPSHLASSPRAYFLLSYLAVAAAALGAVWFLCRLPGANPWAFAASPALLVDAPLNWDALALLPLAAGLWLWASGRARAAAALFAIGACAKLLPVLALVALVAAELRRPRRAMALVAVAAAVAAALNLPFLLTPAGRAGWSWFFEYSRIREIEPSAYLLLGLHPRSSVATANAIGAGALAAAALLLAVLGRAARVRRGPALLLLVGVFFLAGKVCSPQHWLWILAAAAVGGVPGWAAAALGAIATVDFVAGFARLHLQLSRAPELGWYEAHVFWPVVALRYLALAALVGCALSELASDARRWRARGGRRAAGRAIGPAGGAA